MSNILVAWELGENWGHLSRDLPVILELQKLGHNVLCAVSDTRVAYEILDSVGVPFVQAPRLYHILGKSAAVVSHADILVINGYCHAKTLHGLIDAWRGLFAVFKPNAVLIDYAPTATLAARINNLPTILLGTGFEIPPDNVPLPSFRPWEKIPQERLLSTENAVLQSVNRLLLSFSKLPLRKLSELFIGKQTFLTTFQELDHFHRAEQVTYVGPIYQFPMARDVHWPEPRRRARIFAYLRPTSPHVNALLDALNACDADVIVSLPGAPDTTLQKFGKSRISIFSEAVSINKLMQTADLAICHGSGTMAAALLSGVPLMLAPIWAEQYLAALRVQNINAGAIVHENTSFDDINSLLDELLRNSKYKAAARDFSEKYKYYRSGSSVKIITNSILSSIS